MQIIKKAYKKIILACLTMSILVTMLSLGIVSAGAKDTYTNYTEFKGTVLTNCDENDSKEPGKVDKFGVIGTTVDDVEKNGKGSGDLSYDKTKFLQGTSSVKIFVDKKHTVANGTSTGIYAPTTRYRVTNLNVKITDYNTQSVSFYLYIDNVKYIDWAESALELSEVQESLEYQWGFNQINAITPLKDGWNKVVLPLKTALAKNLTIKQLRFFIFAKKSDANTVVQDTFVNIDNIVITAATASASSTPASTPASSTGSVASEVESAVPSTITPVSTVDTSSKVSSSVDSSQPVGGTTDAKTDDDDNLLLIIGIIAAVVVISGVAVFFVLKGKKA